VKRRKALLASNFPRDNRWRAEAVSVGPWPVAVRAFSFWSRRLLLSSHALKTPGGPAPDADLVDYSSGAAMRKKAYCPRSSCQAETTVEVTDRCSVTRCSSCHEPIIVYVIYGDLILGLWPLHFSDAFPGPWQQSCQWPVSTPALKWSEPPGVLSPDPKTRPAWWIHADGSIEPLTDQMMAEDQAYMLQSMEPAIKRFFRTITFTRKKRPKWAW
jgi:hypothetical protein